MPKRNCTACHVGPNFTDEQFHNTGVAWRDGRIIDEGRFAISNNPRDHGAFKTPALREIARTAPYMHDGSMATLEEVTTSIPKGADRIRPSIPKSALATSHLKRSAHSPVFCDR